VKIGGVKNRGRVLLRVQIEKKGEVKIGGVLLRV